mmetsp:Transcript_46009/g.59105  ORF Transcript_46009/g.59105 Transcript_46009/m.59105 type:complete len:201 (+) Transcript_46009:33-635(+)
METIDTAQQIKTLLKASLSIDNKNQGDLLDFVSETVAGYVDEGSILEKIEALSLFQDSGLNLDDDDIEELSSMIELITKTAIEGEINEVDEIDDGTCDLCERLVNRTFHHLVPKETHNRYLRKGKLPTNLEDQGECTRHWLNSHGLMVCGPCHNAIHNAERNETLAEAYNTLERVLDHPKIFAFAKYNSRQPCRIRIRKS